MRVVSVPYGLFLSIARSHTAPAVSGPGTAPPFHEPIPNLNIFPLKFQSKTGVYRRTIGPARRFPIEKARLFPYNGTRPKRKRVKFPREPVAVFRIQTGLSARFRKPGTSHWATNPRRRETPRSAGIFFGPLFRACRAHRPARTHFTEQGEN